MFVQVIQGRTSDARQVRAQLDKWVKEVAPGAVGWLGSTAGVTDDGQVIALARFESEEAVTAWKTHADHQTAHVRGVDELYRSYRVEVYELVRSNGFNLDD